MYNSMSGDVQISHDVFQVTPTNEEFVVIADLHIPYLAHELLDYVVNRHASQNTICVIAGDVLDNIEFSKFASEDESLVIENFLQASEIVKYLSTQFKEVYILDGNHDKRFKKDVIEKLPPVKHFLPNSLNELLAMEIVIEDGKIRPLGKLENVHYVAQRYLKLGNVVITHPTTNSRVPGAAARKLIESLIAHKIDFDIAIFGHTHKQNRIKHLGRIGIETGCLTYYNEYIRFRNPADTGATQGYVYGYFDDGFCYEPGVFDFSLFASRGGVLYEA